MGSQRPEIDHRDPVGGWYVGVRSRAFGVLPRGEPPLLCALPIVSGWGSKWGILIRDHADVRGQGDIYVRPTPGTSTGKLLRS